MISEQLEAEVWYYRPSDDRLIYWFRKARYAVALLIIPLTGIGFATQIGNHSVRYTVLVYLILAGLFVLTVGIAYADHSMTEWVS